MSPDSLILTEAADGINHVLHCSLTTSHRSNSGVALTGGSAGLRDRKDTDKVTDANSAGCNAGSLASRMVSVPLSQPKQDGFSQKEVFSRGVGSVPSSRKAGGYSRLPMVDPQRGRGPSTCSPDGAAGEAPH